MKLDAWSGHISTEAKRRKRARLRHRLRSFMEAALGRGLEALWVTLTTAPGGDASLLAYHAKVLRQRAERLFKYPGMAHFAVQTREGLGVLHEVWVWKGPRPFIVSQKWAAQAWLEIHGAWQLAIRRAALNGGLGQYIERQGLGAYVEQQETLVRISWSWERLFGFPLVAVWRWWRKMWPRTLGSCLLSWRRLMAGEVVCGLPPPLVAVSMESIAAGWRLFRALEPGVKRRNPSRVPWVSAAW